MVPPTGRPSPPARFSQKRLPAPTPSGAGTAETNPKSAAENLSSNGRLVIVVLPMFWMEMLNTTSPPLPAGPGSGLTRVFTRLSCGWVMVRGSASDADGPFSEPMVVVTPTVLTVASPCGSAAIPVKETMISMDCPAARGPTFAQVREPLSTESGAGAAERNPSASAG